MANRSKRSQSLKKEKLYTYAVSVSFDMQFTFTEKEVEPAEEGDENNLDPTERAINKLETELMEYLSLAYPVEKVEAFADFDDLLGVLEYPAGNKQPRKVVIKLASKKAAK